MAVYFAALIGFLTFYGLEHRRPRLRRRTGKAGQDGQRFRIYLSGFAAYVALMAYLLVHNLETSPASIALYALAINFHFLAVDHALRHEYGAVYERVGRFVLAAMSLLGWGTAYCSPFPTTCSPF
jgi:hypothetical protein